MSNQTSNSLSIDGPVSYIPNPEAARLIAALIQTGYFPSSIPACMTGYWPLAVAETSERERFHAFSAFTADLPKEQSWGMMNEVRGFLLPMVRRTEKDRQLFWAKDAMSPPPELEWIVPGLFARPSFNLLVGDPGSKKTYLAMDLAVCVANGIPWLHFPVGTNSLPLSRGRVGDGVFPPIPVLFIDEESGYLQIWSRFNSVLHAHNSNPGAPLAYTSLAGYNLRDPEDADALIKRALSIKAGLTIIDALSDLLSTTDTNASIQPVLFNLCRLAETCNAAVLVIHHTNREGGYRGSSSIAAAVDLMLEISSPPSDSLIEVRTIKARFQAPERFCARAAFDASANSEPRFHLKATDEKPASKSRSPLADAAQGAALSILQILEKNPGATRKQISSHLPNAAQSTIRNVLHQLMQSRSIKRADHGSKGTEASYELTD